MNVCHFVSDMWQVRQCYVAANIQLCTAFILALTYSPVADSAKPNFFSTSSRSQLAVRTEMVSNCGAPKLPMHLENIELRPFGRSSLVGLYADLVVDRDLPRVSRTNVLFERCKERLAPNTCSRFITWRFRRESCDQIENKKALWATIMDFDPPLACPFQKGVYSLRNASLDLDKISKLQYPMKGVARFRIEGFGEEPSEANPNSKATGKLVEKQYSCIQFEVSFVTIRKT